MKPYNEMIREGRSFDPHPEFPCAALRVQAHRNKPKSEDIQKPTDKTREKLEKRFPIVLDK